MAYLEHTLTLGQSLSVGSVGTPSLSTSSEATNAKLVNATTGSIATPLQSSVMQQPQLSIGYRLAAATPAQLFGFSTHGQSGQALAALSKGGSAGRYEASIACVQAAHSVQLAASQSHEIRALHLIQGEADQTFETPAATYLALVAEFLTDYATDIPAITGQTRDLPLILSQTATWAHYENAASIGLVQLEAARTLDDVYIVGGQYHLPYADGLHLTNVGYYKLGELHARAHRAVLAGDGWLPFAPRQITATSTGVVIDFDVPVEPLVLDTTTIVAQTNRGFSLSGTAATITAVTVTGPDQVTLSTSVPITESNARVGYGVAANNGSVGLGNLRDSEPATSVIDGGAIPNWALHFSDPVPPYASRPEKVFAIDQMRYVSSLGKLLPLDFDRAI